MQNRLDAGVLLNLDAQALRAHARRGARRVGHIDGVHAELRQQRAPSISLVQSMPLGGTISTSVTKLPCSTSDADARALAQRRRRRLGSDRTPSRRPRPRAPAHRWRAWPSAWRECGWAWCRSSRPQSARRRRWPCAQSWPCTRASRDRCCGLRRRAACRHWASQPAAAWWRRAWLQWRSAPWLGRWSS